MPLSIADLRAGDRVVLNCPKSKVSKHREAIFEGVFRSLEDARTISREGMEALIVGPETEAFLAGDQPWARFKFGELRDGVDLIGAFKVESDGALREEEGRRITIERRVRMGQG